MQSDMPEYNIFAPTGHGTYLPVAWYGLLSPAPFQTATAWYPVTASGFVARFVM